MKMIVLVVRVFADEDGRHGNELGVVLDAVGIEDELGPKLTAHLGFSETVFVDAISGDSADVRIFTPVTELKLDRSFIVKLTGTNSQRDQDLVRATIDLGHTLGLRIVGEGIEDTDTLDLLTELGCDFGQGFYWSRSLGAEALATWMESPVNTATSRAPQAH